MPSRNERSVQIPIDSTTSLSGSLHIPDYAQGVVLFAHGSGSGRHSPRNRYVAKVLQEASLGTLLFDLLPEQEEIIDEQTRHLRFDIVLLANRLIGATDWMLQRFNDSNTDNEIPSIGYFGASTGAAAALIAAAKRTDAVKAVVSRGGRPDLLGVHRYYHITLTPHEDARCMIFSNLRYSLLRRMLLLVVYSSLLIRHLCKIVNQQAN